MQPSVGAYCLYLNCHCCGESLITRLALFCVTFIGLRKRRNLNPDSDWLLVLLLPFHSIQFNSGQFSFFMTHCWLVLNDSSPWVYTKIVTLTERTDMKLRNFKPIVHSRRLRISPTIRCPNMHCLAPFTVVTSRVMQGCVWWSDRFDKFRYPRLSYASFGKCYANHFFRINGHKVCTVSYTLCLKIGLWVVELCLELWFVIIRWML